MNLPPVGRFNPQPPQGGFSVGGLVGGETLGQEHAATLHSD